MEELETVSYSIDTSAVVLTRDDLDLPGQPAPPSGELEETVLSLWGEVLSVEGLGVDDDFFASGGDSFAAATLVTAIEGSLGVSLPVSILISSPTPRLLAGDVERALDRQAHRSLTPVNTRGGGPPVICVHGMTGEAYAATKIFSGLGENRRFYGVRAQGLGDNEKALASVPEMAARYISEMREVEPHGPYVLLGWCGGGLVAYEMAQRLQAAGETVAGLGLIDPPIERKFAPWLHGLKPGFPFSERMRRFERAIRRGVFRWKLPQIQRRRFTVEHAFYKGLNAYVPRPYHGPVKVLLCEEYTANFEHAHGRWRAVGCQDMEFACIGSDHIDIFEKSIGRVSNELRSFFDRVAPLENSGCRPSPPQ